MFSILPPELYPQSKTNVERYIAKSNPWIVMVSTPNAPGQLFELIEREPADTCLYHRIFLDYTYGLGKIYNEKEIAIARTSPSFEREYNLKYLGSIGNLIPYQVVDAAIEEYELPSEGNRRLTTSSKSEIAFFIVLLRRISFNTFVNVSLIHSG